MAVWRSLELNMNVVLALKNEPYCQLFITELMVQLSSQCLTILVFNNFIKYSTNINKWALTPHRWNVCLGHYRWIVLYLILSFDLWPWRPFQQWPLTWWMFVISSIEIPPLSTEIPHHGRTTGEHDASAACCGRSHNKCNQILSYGEKYVWGIWGVIVMDV